MRTTLVLIFLLLPVLALAQDWEDRRVFGNPEAETQLRIISSTDTSLFAPVIERYLGDNTDLSVEYLVTGTSDIYTIFRENPEAFDVVISSAMDLQIKIANDGFARPLSNVSHPEWAQWRSSLFAFTSEPAAIVINRAAFAGQAIPGTRQELIEALRARPEMFRGRVGTYDVRQSGLGYLFATQDARASETYWRLMEVMGALDVRLYCCSGDMIDDLSDGTIAVAYNVLGSYATARVDSRETLQIILPSDFPTTMMRTAMVSRAAPHPERADAFVRHLIALQSSADGGVLPLPPIDAQVNDPDGATIVLEPALMTFLDALTRKKFLAEWEDAVIQK
ncbi:ABC transporter substrate-binding protein [uncultured Tateyamaria sp.]|uniref:ABC transporter substrate-binding protein n=1 Tax=uncultured Tateyamaria sp. TaxID=455651 RepID=UPI002610CD92|nr:ABC transporter substrate-binding protein [uncultured Tateyamaria sp.]